MEKQISNLENLRKILPKHYMAEFSRRYTKRFTKVNKGDTSPSRQMVYLVLQNQANNHKILEVLIEMAETRNEVTKRLQETVANAQ
jgi:hypothetical protein